MALLIYFIIFTLIITIIGVFVFLHHSGNIKDKEALINYYSSLLSDMNVDYKDLKISPENIHNISISLENFTHQIETLSPEIQKSDNETKKWFLGLIEEFQKALALWTERHGSEIELYEKNLSSSNSSPILLMRKRLEIQGNAMKKIIAN